MKRLNTIQSYIDQARSTDATVLAEERRRLNRGADPDKVGALGQLPGMLTKQLAGVRDTLDRNKASIRLKGLDDEINSEIAKIKESDDYQTNIDKIRSLRQKYVGKIQNELSFVNDSSREQLINDAVGKLRRSLDDQSSRMMEGARKQKIAAIDATNDKLASRVFKNPASLKEAVIEGVTNIDRLIDRKKNPNASAKAIADLKETASKFQVLKFVQDKDALAAQDALDRAVKEGDISGDLHVALSNKIKAIKKENVKIDINGFNNVSQYAAGTLNQDAVTNFVANTGNVPFISAITKLNKGIADKGKIDKETSLKALAEIEKEPDLKIRAKIYAAVRGHITRWNEAYALDPTAFLTQLQPEKMADMTDDEKMKATGGFVETKEQMAADGEALVKHYNNPMQLSSIVGDMDKGERSGYYLKQAADAFREINKDNTPLEKMKIDAKLGVVLNPGSVPGEASRIDFMAQEVDKSGLDDIINLDGAKDGPFAHAIRRRMADPDSFHDTMKLITAYRVFKLNEGDLDTSTFGDKQSMQLSFNKLYDKEVKKVLINKGLYSDGWFSPGFDEPDNQLLEGGDALAPNKNIYKLNKNGEGEGSRMYWSNLAKFNHEDNFRRLVHFDSDTRQRMKSGHLVQFRKMPSGLMPVIAGQPVRDISGQVYTLTHYDLATKDILARPSTKTDAAISRMRSNSLGSIINPNSASKLRQFVETGTDRAINAAAMELATKNKSERNALEIVMIRQALAEGGTPSGKSRKVNADGSYDKGMLQLNSNTYKLLQEKYPKILPAKPFEKATPQELALGGVLVFKEVYTASKKFMKAYGKKHPNYRVTNRSVLEMATLMFNGGWEHRNAAVAERLIKPGAEPISRESHGQVGHNFNRTWNYETDTLEDMLMLNENDLADYELFLLKTVK